MNWSRKLHEPFVYGALGLALTAGFGYGAILVGVLTFGAGIGPWYSTLVQAHGHAQLFGWVGLFVLGMGLYFLPRLRGTPLSGISRVPWAFGLLVGGIVLRSAVQPLAGWLGGNVVLRGLILLSAIIELAGMLVIVSILVQTRQREKPLTRDAPAYSVEPFAQMAFLSLALAFVFNLLGTWNAVSESKNLLAPRYDQLIITLVLYGMALPMTVVFAIRNLPLYLRIPLPSRGVWRSLALFYFLGLTLRCAPFLLAIIDDAMLLTGRVLRANFINVLLVDALAVAGAILLNVFVLVFVLQLRLWRQRAPVAKRGGEGAEEGNVTANVRYSGGGRRGFLGRGYPDNGEYGRFELLIYSAFGWVIIAVILDLVRMLPMLNEAVYVPLDAARHAFMVGFITLLIFGMGARMLPGFSGKRGLAHPELVLWIFVLGNLAAFLRVVPTFFPQSEFALLLWGLSGVFGWSAVVVLGICLLATFNKSEG